MKGGGCEDTDETLKRGGRKSSPSKNEIAKEEFVVTARKKGGINARMEKEKLCREGPCGRLKGEKKRAVADSGKKRFETQPQKIRIATGATGGLLEWVNEDEAQEGGSRKVKKNYRETG